MGDIKILIYHNESSDLLPWEYVMKREDERAVDLNYGAVSCNGDYTEDVRIFMFVQREDASIKPAGQITGGYLENIHAIGDVYLNPGISGNVHSDDTLFSVYACCIRIQVLRLTSSDISNGGIQSRT